MFFTMFCKNIYWKPMCFWHMDPRIASPHTKKHFFGTVARARREPLWWILGPIFWRPVEPSSVNTMREICYEKYTKTKKWSLWKLCVCGLFHKTNMRIAIKSYIFSNPMIWGRETRSKYCTPREWTYGLKGVFGFENMIMSGNVGRWMSGIETK